MLLLGLLHMRHQQNGIFSSLLQIAFATDRIGKTNLHTLLPKQSTFLYLRHQNKQGMN